MLRKSHENSELLDRILLTHNAEPCVNFVDMLMSSDVLLRERTCILLTLLLRHCKNIVDIVWTETVRETLEALVFDSALNVRNVSRFLISQTKQILKFTLLVAGRRGLYRRDENTRILK